MISETEFAELGDSLSTGFFIDKVVMALARTQRLGQLQEQDRPAIADTVQLLGQILDGEKWLNAKQFNGRSGESALAFDRAVSARPICIRASAEFAEYIANLKRIASNLLQEETAESKDIKLVRDFFSGYGKRVFVEAQKVIDRSSELRGLRLWGPSERETT